MAKFETTGQIVTLFVGAACVGVLLIMLLTAEANKRQDALDRSDEIVVTETGDMPELTGIKYIWKKMRSSLRSLSESDNEMESEQKNRRKREVSPDYYSSHVIEGEYDGVIENLESENKNEKQISPTEKPTIHKKSQPSVSGDLGSALLSMALSGHKIRHIEEKIAVLGEDSQLVQTVLDMFCNKDETVLYVMCMETEKSKNSTEADTDHVDDKNTIGHVGTNATADHAKNYTDNIHAYVNVMRNRLAPQVSQPLHSPGICSSYTEFIVVAILTTFLNFFVFVLISLFCRMSKIGTGRSSRESDKLLIVEEDDLANIEEPTVQSEWKKKSGNLHVNLCHQIGLDEEFNKI